MGKPGIGDEDFAPRLGDRKQGIEERRLGAWRHHDPVGVGVDTALARGPGRSPRRAPECQQSPCSARRHAGVRRSRPRSHAAARPTSGAPSSRWMIVPSLALQRQRAPEDLEGALAGEEVEAGGGAAAARIVCRSLARRGPLTTTARETGGRGIGAPIRAAPTQTPGLSKRTRALQLDSSRWCCVSTFRSHPARNQSGRWGSNPRHQAWEACALPTELRPQTGGEYKRRIGRRTSEKTRRAERMSRASWERAIVAHQTLRKYIGRPKNKSARNRGRYCLQLSSASTLPAEKSQRSGLNRRPPDYESGALPLSYAGGVCYAQARTRTATPFGTTPSRWRVYQFHHLGTSMEQYFDSAHYAPAPSHNLRSSHGARPARAHQQRG